jgi:hypothetical protein
MLLSWRVRAVHAREARRLIVRASEIFSAYKSASLVRLLAADTSAAVAPRRQDDDDGVPSPDFVAQVENDPIVKAAIQVYEEARAKAAEARKRI